MSKDKRLSNNLGSNPPTEHKMPDLIPIIDVSYEEFTQKSPAKNLNPSARRWKALLEVAEKEYQKNKSVDR